ncbi:hypothetical protein [Fulvivirga sedimenti]|uniref:DUF4136 domain-containing protein n=1 Tax=Fulvivirga sedimenti TaxID=2879465 RepID=A0A9X1HV80_9BACT|nr:hypothetical protein [Fulvivirga sedimenti]MCA6078894.1 hypothetical protein [Fulvivirga sedimenti]
MKKYAFYFALIVILGSCSSSIDPDPQFTGQDFFPLEIGRFVEYNVTHTIYPVNGAPVTDQFVLRQEIVDTINNQAGGLTYVLYRWRRDQESDPWQFVATWSARLENNRIVINEGNTPFIKISLPARNELMWNGNALNSMQEDNYVLTGLDLPYSLPDQSAIPSMTVIQEEFDDLVIGERDIRREIYGRNVGLLKREIISLALCPIGECPNEEVIEGGFEYTETIRSYGLSQ